MATAVHFPTNSGLIFLTDVLTNDTRATLSIIPHNSKNKPSGPLLKETNGLPIPSRGFLAKAVQFSGKLFTFHFLQAAVAGPSPGTRKKKFKVAVAPYTSQILFACTAAAPAAVSAFLSSILWQPPMTPVLPGSANSSPPQCRW
jgi:hypothetical protein